MTIIKLDSVVKGDPKTLFSIATPSRCREGRYSFNYLNQVIFSIR